MDSSTRDKYELVFEENKQGPKNEIRITKEGLPMRFFNYGLMLFLEFLEETVILKASGNAIYNAFFVAELLRRKIPDLHTQN